MMNSEWIFVNGKLKKYFKLNFLNFSIESIILEIANESIAIIESTGGTTNFVFGKYMG